MTGQPIDLSKSPVHLTGLAGADAPAQVLKDFGFDGPSFGAYIEAHTKPGAPGRIVMIEASPTNWGGMGASHAWR